MATMRQGMVLVSDGKSRLQPLRLQLSHEYLTLQKEELVYAETQATDTPPISRERRVLIPREPVGGLGLSVKGGSEHNLPIIISKIFKGQAADKTGELFVGDAIVKVNNISVEHATHDEAITALRAAGDSVLLQVNHFRPATLFLKPGVPVGSSEVQQAQRSLPKLQKNWTNVLSIPLLYAYLTRFNAGTDKIRANSFEVFAMDGTPSGYIHCEDSNVLADWIRSINNIIATLNNHAIQMSNKLLLPSEHITHMCWVCERQTPNKHWQSGWRPQFVALRGGDIFVFDSPPINTRDWVRCGRIYKIYESMFRILKDQELVDSRQHCFLLQAQGETGYMSVETREDLLRLEKAWYKANYTAVAHMGNRTFGCTWRGRISGLTLDLQTGFSLYDSESKSYMWSYKFSKLKGSSDDGKTKLKLHFQNNDKTQIETRELECTNLKTLLFCMHAFLSAKLASVDPNFLRNF